MAASLITEQFNVQLTSHAPKHQLTIAKCVVLAELNNCFILESYTLVNMREEIKIKFKEVIKKQRWLERNPHLMGAGCILRLKQDVIYCCRYNGISPKLAIYHMLHSCCTVHAQDGNYNVWNGDTERDTWRERKSVFVRVSDKNSLCLTVS